MNLFTSKEQELVSEDVFASLKVGGDYVYDAHLKWKEGEEVDTFYESLPFRADRQQPVEPAPSLYEGDVRAVTLDSYERNAAARRKCLEHYGYSCQACGVHLFDVYGPAGQGVIHVHHHTPISTAKARHEVDPVGDLVPLCPNCHSVAHRRATPYTLADLRAMLRR